MSASALLERMVDPIGKLLTPESAKEILEIRADNETQQRVDELADKCNEGHLSVEEQSEYQELVSLFNILTLLQARARSVLESGEFTNGR